MWNWYSMKCMKMFEGTFWIFLSDTCLTESPKLPWPNPFGLASWFLPIPFPGLSSFFQNCWTARWCGRWRVEDEAQRVYSSNLPAYTNILDAFFWGGRSRLWEVLESKAAVAMLVLMQFQSIWDSQQLWVYDTLYPSSFFAAGTAKA